MKTLHKACYSVVHYSSFADLYYCQHCDRHIESIEVIRPTYKLADCISVIKGSNAIAEMIINAIGKMKGGKCLNP